MTEEIIIDGVDVAGCGAYKDKHCIDKTSIIFCDTNLCSNYPYCYYKQLKRLEQENKELKIWLESKEKQLKHLIEYNQNKKDQIKTLRFMLFDEKEIPKDKFTMMYRIAQNERRTRSHRDLCTNITKKYRSALEEIRKECKCYGRQRGSNREFDREYGGELHINIIEQINEVLE